ncbi:MAG: hypothetical protein CMF61_06160 [Magnetococcales bacterium]|nr:hypothetical protein [Magnetococcales bacterium]PPR17438.1 MAG: Glycosyltransferase Gtf1 [Pseudomonadota bacterium]
MPKVRQKHILINAIHCKTGGGLVTLNHVIPYLAKDESFKVTVIANKGYEERISMPENVNLQVVNVPESFLKMIWWEQVNIPKIARKLRADITFNFANYAPLMSPNNVLYITNNPEVRHYVPFNEKLYWYALIGMTTLSLFFSKVGFTNGRYIQGCYAMWPFSFLKKKMVVATTACDVLKGCNPKKEYQILAVGDFYPHKNYPLLLKAFSRVLNDLPDLKLNIIGRPVRVDIADEMKSLIKKLKLEGNVQLLGAKPLNETKELMANSLVYVNPSDAETFSLTLLEAMTLGTASIVKNYDFQKEVSGESGAFYVPASNQEHLNVKLWSEAIVSLVQDENKRTMIEQNAMENVRDISWEKMATTIVTQLKNIK